jgi:hypothetical protein
MCTFIHTYMTYYIHTYIHTVHMTFCLPRTPKKCTDRLSSGRMQVYMSSNRSKQPTFFRVGAFERAKEGRRSPFPGRRCKPLQKHHKQCACLETWPLHPFVSSRFSITPLPSHPITLPYWHRTPCKHPSRPSLPGFPCWHLPVQTPVPDQVSKLTTPNNGRPPCAKNHTMDPTRPQSGRRAAHKHSFQLAKHCHLPLGPLKNSRFHALQTPERSGQRSTSVDHPRERILDPQKSQIRQTWHDVSLAGR